MHICYDKQHYKLKFIVTPQDVSLILLRAVCMRAPRMYTYTFKKRGSAMQSPTTSKSVTTSNTAKVLPSLQTSALAQMTDLELEAYLANLKLKVQDIKTQNLALDMTRGKPSHEQVALSAPMLDLLNSQTPLVDEGVEVANYGAPCGIPSARKLAAQILGTNPVQTLVMGSSSLNIMYDLVCHGFTMGIAGNKPWHQQPQVKWLCPAPGYDRHFAITAAFGIKNIPIPMNQDGPDMDMVRRLVENDPAVKGIWCVPKYANPTGVVYSDEVVRCFAALKPAAPDFRIFWDNAYCVHGFGDEEDTLLNIFDAVSAAQNQDLVYEFGSTAKMTFPGSGMAYVAASPADIAEIKKVFSLERVCPEKISQLAHTLFLKDLEGVKAHMSKHAALLAPRFALVEDILTQNLGELGIASWSHPHGGYFVSFEGVAQSARKIVQTTAELGVALTPAGSTWPYGDDPNDSNIRLAPTYPSFDELKQALEVFVVAVQLVSAQMEQARRSRAGAAQ